MKLITKQTDYAIRALGAMAKEKDSIFTTSFLAKKLKISKPFVRAILQKLNKEHMLVSYKGKGGGFKMVIYRGMHPTLVAATYSMWVHFLPRLRPLYTVGTGVKCIPLII